MEIKKGLVLEGGAMRGMFTAGVMDVFMENGIRFDAGAGISAGAIFGCNYKSRQIGRVIRYNKKWCTDPRYCSLKSLITTGDLYGVDFCYHRIPDELDVFDRETFKNDPMEFYVGATDVHTGKIRFHRCRDGGEKDIEWMRASASMPLVSRAVEIDGRKYLDGGIADSVPYRVLEKLGCNRNVIILTRPDGYRKKRSRASFALKIVMGKYPVLARAMENRYEMYNRQMEEIKKRETRGEALVIRPEKDLGISRTSRDPEELERVYRIGRREGEARLNAVKRFLEEGQA